MPELISRQEAIATGQTRYFTGKPCKHGHIAERWVRTRVCSDCNAMHLKNLREKNGDYYRAKCRQWASNNPEVIRENNRRWRKANHKKILATNATREATKIKATPKWLTEQQKAEIVQIYKTCPEGHHVDHIVPLKGVNVCGLHVPWNLQHLSAFDNLSKKNRF